MGTESKTDQKIMTSDATTRQSPQTQVLTEEDYDKDYWLKILEKRHSVKYMPIIVMTITC